MATVYENEKLVEQHEEELRALGLVLLGVVLAAALFFALIYLYYERVLPAEGEPGAMPYLSVNQELLTVNTTRIGSDDPVETAVAVAQLIYPATEEENTPGAVILINRNNLAEAVVAASRVQHFPVNAPLLYVDENAIPELTRSELLRLQPEGVPMDGNVQVYVVGSIGDAVVEEVREMGYQVRVMRAPDPASLAEVADNWSSTQHGDHPNDVVIANLDNLMPALPSAFWNAHMGDGLAFVTDEGIPEPTRRILDRRANGPWIYVFGDESVVSEEIVRELGQYGQVTRIPHNDLVGASVYFAGFADFGGNWGAWIFEDSRSFGWGLAEAGHNAIFVNGDGPGGWQNVIPATTLSHMGKHAPVLAVNQDGVPDAVASYLEIWRPYRTAPQFQLLNHGLIIGGEETIDWNTQVQLDLLLEGQWDEILDETEGGQDG